MESRRKKKVYVDNLEQEFKKSSSENRHLRVRVRELERANEQLQQQLRKQTASVVTVGQQSASLMTGHSKMSAAELKKLPMLSLPKEASEKLGNLRDARVVSATAIPVRRSPRDRNSVKSTYLLALVLSVMLVLPGGPSQRDSNGSESAARKSTLAEVEKAHGLGKLMKDDMKSAASSVASRILLDQLDPGGGVVRQAVSQNDSRIPIEVSPMQLTIDKPTETGETGDGIKKAVGRALHDKDDGIIVTVVRHPKLSTHDYITSQK